MSGSKSEQRRPLRVTIVATCYGAAMTDQSYRRTDRQTKQTDERTTCDGNSALSLHRAAKWLRM